MRNGLHVHLLHNPKAGDQDPIKEGLINTIESHGFTCQYASIKDKSWKRFRSDTALVVIAGGDGTVREVMKKLLKRRVLDRRLTVALLPSGTANNFAKTLGISTELADFQRSLAGWNTRKIDIGAIDNLRDAQFFMEGMGCGLIPRLITEMKALDTAKIRTADEELQVALGKLLEISENYRAKRATVIIDGKVYEDDYLLVEILNIRSVGPNLILAPDASPADGKFEVVLLKEADRSAFADTVRRLMRGSHPGTAVPWNTITAMHEVTIRCENRLVHVDDELITHKKGKVIRIEMRHGIIDMIT